MSHAAKEIITASRPPGFRGRGDKYLADIAGGLQRLLLKTQERHAYPTCRLQREEAGQLAATLVDFAEDVHADIGLWRAVEHAQQQCFGTPLPFLVDPADTAPLLTPFDRRRVQYLLWMLLPRLIDDLILSPAHQDLRLTAEVVSKHLGEQFAAMPKDSGVKQFLGTDNQFGWDIKRKLFWLGTKSYLFRLLCRQYLDANADPTDWVSSTDDFICQECTIWSGMGVIDVLAGALELPDDDRTTLRSWYERHTSAYRVLTRHVAGAETEFITARNVVNGAAYTIRMNMPDCPFVPGTLVFGALTPWRGEWYWSGSQKSFGMAAEAVETGIRRDMLEKSSNIAFRYCLPEAELARKMAGHHHAQFIAHYGNDLAVFPDGLSLAASEQKRMQFDWSVAAPDVVARAMREGGLTEPRVQMKFPPGFLNHEDGIGVFSHPVEGIDYLLHFNQVISGLRKRGVGLTDGEADALRGAVTSSVICPAFVHRLVAEHGAESIADAFRIRDQPTALVLEVLLRRYKGAHCRRRYPSISLVGS